MNGIVLEVLQIRQLFGVHGLRVADQDFLSGKNMLRATYMIPCHRKNVYPLRSWRPANIH